MPVTTTPANALKDFYRVTVGNIGDVSGPHHSRKQADADFEEYVAQSQAPHMRASGEEVILWLNGEPLREYTPR